MSEFYTEISKYYNDIFPTGEIQIQFLKDAMPNPPKEVLDVACGSGGYAKALTKAGYNVTAIDLDSSMIEELGSKDNDIDTMVLDMLDIDMLDDRFDLIYSIGNSLVHLESEEEVLEFLLKSTEKLSSDGSLVIQILNYNRILDKKIEYLPLIENNERNLIFERYYEYIPETEEDYEKLKFRTVLKVDDLEFNNEEILLPIRSEKLVELLENAGYNDISMYGDFKKSEYNESESYSLVLVAKINEI